ncbi:MAG: Gfo/Idh/MocA family oxidoreductase [Bacteroidota bacterium]|jgi:predicted dehydrogenase
MKVGIAGTGFMGETHALCYTKLPDTKLYAAAEQNLDKQKYFQKKFPDVKMYDNFFEMIEDNEIDIIDICLPTPLHAKTAIAALSKNKHVLLEKPVALHLEDAWAIKQAAENSKGKLMTAHVLRFFPQYSVIRKAIREYLCDEKITEIYASRFNELPLWSENTWIMNEELSGGLIIDLMIHDIDFIIWNCGKVNKVFSTGIYNEKNFAVQVMAVLQLEKGITAYVEGGYLNPSGYGLYQQMRVYSNNSLLEMYTDKNTIKLSQKNQPAREINIPGNDGYFEEINYFVDCIKHGKDPEIITTDEAIESLKICLALKKSLKETQWISIN